MNCMFTLGRIRFHRPVGHENMADKLIPLYLISHVFVPPSKYISGAFWRRSWMISVFGAPCYSLLRECVVPLAEVFFILVTAVQRKKA